jgi:hypothetical protein
MASGRSAWHARPSAAPQAWRTLKQWDQQSNSGMTVNFEVSIIIVNWNARDILRDCLSSIAAETPLAHEVIVVDNASSDGSAAMVRSQFPGVRLIANSENRGFAAANNQGIEIAGGRYILLLNPDTMILDHAIDTMVAWCDGHPDVGCAGCQVLESETTVQSTCFSDPGPVNLLLIETGLCRLFPNSRFFGRPYYGWWDRSSERDVDVVSGMFMLMPRPVLETVGPLDEAFFIYSEEADWCRRIRNAGYRCVFTPVARILHLEGGGKSAMQVQSRMYVQLQKSKLHYVRKHDGLFGYAFTRFAFSVLMAARWVVFSALGLISRNQTHRKRSDLARAGLAFHCAGLVPKA